MENPKATTVKFNMSIHNELSKEKFRKYFYFLICKKAPCIDFNEALLLLDGNARDRVLAMDMLLIFSHKKLKRGKKLLNYTIKETKLLIIIILWRLFLMHIIILTIG